MKTNSKEFIKRNFPELLNYKIFTSRKYESKEKKHYKDDWWFNFLSHQLEKNEYLVFAGALDFQSKNFKIFKVPTSFSIKNSGNYDETEKGWINLYIHINDYIDVRNKANLSFAEFAIN